MAIPFTLSMRALHADSHLSTLVGLGVALALLAVWAAWFFLAGIALKATGQVVTTTREGTVIATFPQTAWGTIRRGQQAVVRPQGDNPAQQSGPLPSVVAEVTQHARADGVQVELYVREDAATRRMLRHGMRGDVEVVVAHVSPATLVMRRRTVP